MIKPPRELKQQEHGKAGVESRINTQQTSSPTRLVSKELAGGTTVYDQYIRKKKMTLTNLNPPKKVRFCDDETHSGFVSCETRMG